MQLSKYQEAILEAVSDRIKTNSNKGIIIEALAGCGKSFTLKLIAERLAQLGIKGSECRFVVFGRKNKADLQDKLSKLGKPWQDGVKTLNSLGYEVLRDALEKRHSSFNVDRDKYNRIAQELNYVDSVDRWGGKIKGTLTTPIGNSDEQAIKSEGILIDLIDKLRGDCVEELTEVNVNEVVNRYGLEIKYHHIPDVTKAAKKIIEVGHKRALERLHIDFCDQSWILYLERETPAFKKSFERFKKLLRFIAIDEAQDTDKLQIEMIKLLHSDNNFICPVGDKWQAVYFFRGCLSDGMEKMNQTFNCESFELPVNFRCGKKHLNLVRELYPKIQIQPHDKAPEGEIICIKESEFINSIGDYHNLSHFAICRKNAPLLTFAIRCLTHEIPARIKDKQLAGKIVYRVEQVCKKRYDKSLFLMQLEQWRTESFLSLDKLPERIQEIKKQEIKDYSECMIALFEKFQPASIKEWRACIESICDEEKNGNFIDFFSIHSGKGGEGDRSFMIYPHLQPVEFKGQGLEEYQQEKNMIYVALTRTLAKHPDGEKLFLVLQEQENGGVYWPSWLPNEYRKLEGEESELIPVEQPDFLSIEPRLLESEQWSGEVFDGSDADTDDQWECPCCGWWNTSSYTECSECGTGIWECECGAFNDDKVAVCSSCGVVNYPSPDPFETFEDFEEQYNAWKEYVGDESELHLSAREVWEIAKPSQAIATTEEPETSETSLQQESIEENCSRTQFSPLDQFELGLKVGLSIPLEQMTNEEKREKVREAIKLDPDLSARAIADSLGVSNKFVSKIKKQMIENEEIKLSTEVRDKKGRLIETSRIGSTKQRKPIKDKLAELISDYEPNEEEVKELIEFLQTYLF